ncbi:MAG: LytTR family DNA-binding domain-containing protein [Roseburia sp.]|nr:LytTR family DNA-binding domain-containing protein [Roseburia sp.]MCM1279683.1 LytTR family DNA-binding domain-containing protein [Robinsoniella sp.]
MIKIALCDDEKKIVSNLKKLIEERYGDVFSITTAQHPEELMCEWKESPHKTADILISDIQFETEDGQQSGILLAKKIQERYPKAQIIFMTGYLHYATEIFEASPVYFLLKPIEKEHLYKALDKSIAKVQSEWKKSIHIEQRGTVEKIPANEILYIENKGRNLIFHMKGADKCYHMKIGDIEAKLPPHFLRPHQSYLINMDYIKEFNRTELILQNDVKVPISRTKYPMAKEKILFHFNH